MAYTPDATNVAQPADVGVQASTAAAEFRTLKTYIQSTVLPSIALKAPLASPALTGTPTAPTAAVDTNTTQLATTAYVVGNGYLKSATAASTYAPLASPSLTGNPTAPTQAVDNNTTRLATTAYVINQLYLKAATAAATYAPLVSPALTGTATVNAIEIGFRRWVQASITSGTPVAADSGKCIYASGNCTIPSGVFAIGDEIAIANPGGPITITQGGGMTLIWNGTTGSRTLAGGARALISFISGTGAFIDGLGVS